jgi:hypothetical protein
MIVSPTDLFYLRVGAILFLNDNPNDSSAARIKAAIANTQEPTPHPDGLALCPYCGEMKPLTFRGHPCDEDRYCSSECAGNSIAQINTTPISQPAGFCGLDGCTVPHCSDALCVKHLASAHPELDRLAAHWGSR